MFCDCKYSEKMPSYEMFSHSEMTEMVAVAAKSFLIENRRQEDTEHYTQTLENFFKLCFKDRKNTEVLNQSVS